MFEMAKVPSQPKESLSEEKKQKSEGKQIHTVQSPWQASQSSRGTNLSGSKTHKNDFEMIILTTWDSLIC